MIPVQCIVTGTLSTDEMSKEKFTRPTHSAKNSSSWNLKLELLLQHFKFFTLSLEDTPTLLKIPQNAHGMILTQGVKCYLKYIYLP